LAISSSKAWTGFHCIGFLTLDFFRILDATWLTVSKIQLSCGLWEF
jgi:hypothetical protein